MYDYPQYFLDVPDKVSFEFHLFLDKVYTSQSIVFVPSSYLPAEYQGKQASANREYLKYIIYIKNFYIFFNIMTETLWLDKC